MAVLVTGLGYIGIALAWRLLERGERVVGLENGFSSVPDALSLLARQPGLRLVRGSVNSAGTLDRALGGDNIGTIFHLAGQASADPGAAPAAYTERTNLVGPRLVFEAAARHGVQRVVYGSSFKLYGDDLAGTVSESRPYGFVGDLAHVTKLYAEKLLEMLAARHPIAVANVRLGIVYGLGPAMKLDQRFLTVPNLFCLRAAMCQTLVVRPGANRPMAFLHLDDAVDALIAADSATRGPGARALNAVSEVLTVGEVAGLVAEAAAARGIEACINGAANPPPERYRVTSALAEVGWAPRRMMRESLPEALDHFLREARGGGENVGPMSGDKLLTAIERAGPVASGRDDALRCGRWKLKPFELPRPLLLRSDGPLTLQQFLLAPDSAVLDELNRLEPAELQELALARLRGAPPDARLSLFGQPGYTMRDVVRHVEEGTPLGMRIIDAERKLVGLLVTEALRPTP